MATDIKGTIEQDRHGDFNITFKRACPTCGADVGGQEHSVLLESIFRSYVGHRVRLEIDFDIPGGDIG